MNLSDIGGLVKEFLGMDDTPQKSYTRTQFLAGMHDLIDKSDDPRMQEFFESTEALSPLGDTLSERRARAFLRDVFRTKFLCNDIDGDDESAMRAALDLIDETIDRCPPRILHMKASKLCETLNENGVEMTIPDLVEDRPAPPEQ